MTFSNKKMLNKTNFGIARFLFLHIFSKRSITQGEVRKCFLVVVGGGRNKGADPDTH